MAVTSPTPVNAPARRPRQSVVWSRVHFVVRLLGLTGGLLACVCGVLAGVQGAFQPFLAGADVRSVFADSLRLTRTALAEPLANRPMMLFLVGAATGLFAVLVELVVVLGFSATRRSAFGFNAVVQTALAAVLLVAVNVWSFYHYERVDFTRDQQFTLPAEIRKDLAQLHSNSPTTIIVYNRHKVFGLARDKDKPEDDYDKEAQRKVIEKVHDLAEQFRALGRQFKVEVLDTESRDYKFQERLQEVTAAAAREARGGARATADDKHAQGIEAQVQAEAETLRKMIQNAPENSLFFCGRENEQFRVQQLSFNDFYLLDKTLSEDDRGGRGNLVLLYQGVEPFARRLLKLGEKKPRIALATIHEVLSSGSEYDIGLASLRKALETRGFDVADIVLKRENKDTFRLEAAVYSLEETKLERCKREESEEQKHQNNLRTARAEIEKDRDFWNKAGEDEKTRASFLKQIAEQAPEQARDYAQNVQEADATIGRIRRALLAVDIDAIKARLQRELNQWQEEREWYVELRDLWRKAIDDGASRAELLRRAIKDKVDERNTALERIDQAIRKSDRQLAETRADKAKLNVRALEDQQQMSDLKAKLQRLLADCDLLIVPRMTLRNTAASGFAGLRPQFYPLETPQVEAIKEFLKAGKPVLACFGPLNWPPAGGGNGEADGLENLLAELGVKMLKQTVLFDVEEKAFAENRAGLSIAGSSVEVPPLIWDWLSRDSLPPGRPDLPRPHNRIRDSIRLTARGLGKEETLDLRIRDPRPVYFVPPEPTSLRPLAAGILAAPAQPNWTALTLSLTATQQYLDEAPQQLGADPVFLMTSPQSWNEDNPFPSDDRVPQFEQPKSDKDKRRQLKPAQGLETRRRGPFPIGVAVETTLPRNWYDSRADQPARVRLAVIGQGGFFTGNEKQKLPAAEEKVLVHTIDWLLGRDDRLPRDGRLWSYPRVNDTIPPDSPTEYLWLWGVRLGLPALFAYFGLVVLLFRRLR